MFMNSPNYRSDICNTDIYGLRFNSKNNLELNKTIFDQETNKERALMIGSSTTFGVGSTSDENTIPGFLSNNSNYFFYNFGGRAFNGFQEIILFQLLSKKLNGIKKIVLYSGMNDAYMTYNKSFISRYPGPFYYNKNFLEQMDKTNLTFNRKILKFLLPNLEIDYRFINIKDLINYLFTKNFRDNYKSKKSFPMIELEEIVTRNIHIWLLLSKSINAELSFFFPPFLPWCKNKNNYSKEEEEIVNYLAVTKEKANYEYYDKIAQQYEKIKKLFEDLCKKSEIKFYDCNNLFQLSENNKKWLFVDKVHLTDYGNKLISDYIIDKS